MRLCDRIQPEGRVMTAQRGAHAKRGGTLGDYDHIPPVPRGRSSPPECVRGHSIPQNLRDNVLSCPILWPATSSTAYSAPKAEQVRFASPKYSGNASA